MAIKIYDVDPAKTYRVAPGKCYACDQKVVGAALHNGKVQGACKRHRYPDMRSEVRAPECYICGGSVAKNQGLYDDWTDSHAHLKCLKAECEN